MGNEVLPGGFEIVAIGVARNLAPKLNGIERTLVRYAYPPKVILDGQGVAWAIHFLHEGEWQLSVYALVIFGILGIVASKRVPVEALARTLIGKIMLELSKPWNLVAQVCGLSIVNFGIWEHSAFYVLIGSTVLLTTQAVAASRVLLPRLGAE